MNNCCHQTQNATGTLEVFHCCPFLIQTIEYFRMNRIAGNQTISVLDFSCINREITLIILIHLAERSTNLIPFLWLLAIQEESSSYDLKAFICRYRFPDGFFTAKCVFDCFECLLAGISTDLNSRFRNRSYNHTVLAGTCSLCYLLNKGNKVIKRA